MYASSGLFAALHNQGFVDVGDHTTTSDGSLDQSVKFFISANGELQVARSDSLHLKVLASVAGKLEHLGGEVLKNGSSVDGRRGTDTTVRAHSALQESVDSSNGELNTRSNKYDEAGQMAGTQPMSLLLLLTWSPALADLDWGCFLDFPMPNFPPLPPFPFPPA